MASWNKTTLRTESEVLDALQDLKGKQWMCRGQSRLWNSLIPSIDRNRLQHLSRADKLSLERRSIDLWQSSAKYFSNQGEEFARNDNIITLMVLRHYDVPTRLLDWSISPWVAAYFAVERNDKEDAEIWSFDRRQYETKGKKQWMQWPQTTTDLSGNPDKFDAKLTAFSLAEPPDWFICAFYGMSFPRQHSQKGAYSLTARFNRDHAEAIANLLKDTSAHHRYIVKADLKAKLRKTLREQHGLWLGSLFPDAAGAAETVRRTIFKDRQLATHFLYAAIGEFIVKFSHLNSILELLTASLIAKNGDESAHRRASAAIIGLTTQPLSDCFFSVLIESREIPWTEADKELIKESRKEINSLIAERNRIAHDVWSLGHPNRPRPSNDAWERIKSSRSATSGYVLSAKPITADQLNLLSEDANRLSSVIRALALAGLTGDSYAPSESLHIVEGPDGRRVEKKKSC